MSKRRPPASIFEAVQDALAILRDDGVQAATGKSARYIRQCSDPDDRQHLGVDDAIALDAHCLVAGAIAPIRTAYDAQLLRRIEALGGTQHQAQDPRLRFTAVMSEIGDVAEALRAGADGFTVDELAAARRQLREAQAALAQLDRDLVARGPNAR